MTDRYINLDDLVVLLKTYADRKHINGHNDTANGILSAVSFIRNQPTANVKEVVYGEWLNFYNDYSVAECSECAECYEVSPDAEPKAVFFDAFKEYYKFCPNCGADMRGNPHEQ